MSIGNTLLRAAKGVHNALYRRFDSPRIRRIAGLPILLLTVRGRRSGRELTTPLVYVEHAGGYAVIGTANGSDTEPQWFRNLRATDEATIEIGHTTRRVQVRVLEGVEREAVLAVFLRDGTTMKGYTKKTDRVFPIALLTPI